MRLFRRNLFKYHLCARY